MGLAASIASTTGEKGDRASDYDDCIFFCDDMEPDPPDCPSGEACSDDTPFGLIFSGPDFGDAVFELEQPKVTAVGGTQTIRIRASRGPTPSSFDAVSDGAAFAIGAIAPPAVEVIGQEPGSAKLRILEPGTDLLYDRITLETGALSRVSLRPASDYIAGDLSIAGDPTAEVAVVVGSTAAIVVALFDAADNRLIDDTLVIGEAPEISVVPETFDTVLATPTQVGDTSLSITAAAQSFDIPLRAVDSVDQVAWTPALGQEDAFPAELAVDQTLPYCFRATTGGAIVVGAAWSIMGTAGVALQARPDRPNCVWVTGVEPGDAVITVSAENRTQFFPVEVLQAGASPAAWNPAPMAPALGERASAAR